MVKYILIFFCFVSFACSNSSKQLPPKITVTSINSIDTFSYVIFPVADNGFGFNIIKNDRIYIHQPFIPSWQGLRPFPNKESAEAIAVLLTKKLQKYDFSFLLQKGEVDSLMKKFANRKAADVSSSLHDVNLPSTRTLITYNPNAASVINALPFLPDMPVKRRWSSKGLVPFGFRGGALGFTLQENIYMGAGELKDKTASDFWMYNAKKETWTCVAEIPGGVRVSGVAFSIKNKGYVGLGSARGGVSQTFKNDFYEYDPLLNTWSRKSDFPGGKRIDAAAFSIKNFGYAGLGFNGSYCEDFYKYNPLTNTWSKVALFSGGPVSASIGISTATKGFIIAGDKATNNQKFVYEYIPERNIWLERRDIPGKPRYFTSGYTIDSGLFIVGGGRAEGGELHYKDFYMYNTQINNWSSLPDYPITKAGTSRLIGGSVSGKVYMGAGYNGNFLNTWNAFEYYFAVRKDIGIYNETVCYPLQYNGTWQLYQECTIEDCYAGAQIKTSENLGNFCYSSSFSPGKMIKIKNENGKNKNMYLFSRNFAIRTEKQPNIAVSIRLFFSREEIEKSLKERNTQTGNHYLIEDILVLQYNDKDADTDPFNNNFEQKKYSLIHPRWYQYGYNAQTLVAEISVSQLSSEFYLTLPGK